MCAMKISSILLRGFKSIDQEGQTILFGNINIFLGANGAGKSNLVSFFKMLNYMTTEALQIYIGEQGYSDSILHYGSSLTPLMQAEVVFEDDRARDTYNFTLVHASKGKLIFTEEYLTWLNAGRTTPIKINLESGHDESRLVEDADQGGRTSRFFLDYLRLCKVYHFHDTSSTAKIRNPCYINDNKFLRHDAGNLSAFLYALKKRPNGEKYYQKIIRHIKAIVPQFKDFLLEPDVINPDYIRLDWQDNTKSDYTFGPHQISDGALRFMAMTTLLMQPPEIFPKAIILDEPELGLHPAAISALAGMIRSASRHCQIIIATQSTRLVDEFEVPDIIIVERDKERNRSLFRRLDPESLTDWIERYSLSQLWEKNILGGRP